MATKFNMTKDVAGYNGFGLVPTDTAYSATLAVSTDTSLTIPSSSSIGGAAYYNKQNTTLAADQGKPRLIAIIVSDPGESVWVAKNTAASVPAGSTFAATASAMNPAAYEVIGGDVLHFFTATANVQVSVRLYWLT